MIGDLACPDLQFPANVRVVDFKGVCYPVAYLGAPVEGEDYRSLLYWHPALKLGLNFSSKTGTIGDWVLTE